MVLQSTDIPFRYPTPISPNSASTGKDPNHQLNNGLPTPVTNGAHEYAAPGQLPTPKTAPPDPSTPSRGHLKRKQSALSADNTPRKQASRPPPSTPPVKDVRSEVQLQRPQPKVSVPALPNGFPMSKHADSRTAKQPSAPQGQSLPSGQNPQPGPGSTKPVVVLPPPQSKHIRDSQSSFTSDASLQITPEGQTSPPRTAPQSESPTKASNFSVIVPRLPPSSEPSQHRRSPEADAEFLRRSSLRVEKENEDIRTGFDHREQAGEYVEALERLMMTIFEAEDEIQTGSAGQSFFSGPPDNDGQSPPLTSETLSQLDSALLKVVKANRLKEIPVEQLCHLQRFCSSNIVRTSDVDLAIPNEIAEDALNDWTERVKDSVDSLRAARIMLRMMTAGREENELYSDDKVQDLLTSFKHLIDDGVLPQAEKKDIVADSEVFQSHPQRREALVLLAQHSGRVMKLLGDLVLQTELSETATTTIEDLAMRLVFVETTSTEKESVLGMQRVEVVRRHAMDTVAKIFLRRADQRTSILDEILSSLERLPINRQSARQYKIPGLKPIQLVSALIMQVIQTTTMTTMRNEASSIEVRSGDADATPGSSEADSDSSPSPSPTPIKPKKGKTKSQLSTQGDVFERLSAKVTPLIGNATFYAAHVMRYLVRRAVTSTKSGDQPYRNLLDIFTEDFCNVLVSPAWPAAAVLLQALLSNLVGIMKDGKSATPAKNMVLDLMGSIGSYLADMRVHLTKVGEVTDSSAEAHLQDFSRLCEESLTGSAAESELLKINGPFRMFVEHLAQGDTNDVQLQGALSYHLADWSSKSLTMQQQSQDKSSQMTEQLASWLLNVFSDHSRILEDKISDTIAENSARNHYLFILMSLPVCKVFPRLLEILLSSLTSQQTTLRNRSLKSVIQLLDKDPSILDQSPNVLNQIIRCTTDASPMVRDSALGLVSKCVNFRPLLESKACVCFIQRSSDPAIGVRKRALKLLREAYLRDIGHELRSAIAGAILTRLKDTEDTIIELARQTIEEMWLNPFHSASTAESLPVQTRKELDQLAFLITATSQRGLEATETLETLFKDAVKPGSRTSSANQQVCRHLVALLFDCLIDNDQSSGRPNQRQCLHALTIFAKADPNIFTAEQMGVLKPYLSNLTCNEDLQVYRSTVMIYRRVLPVLPPLQRIFLSEVQKMLLSHVQKLPSAELQEGAQCLAIIDKVLQETETLLKVTLNILKRIAESRGADLLQEQNLKRVCKLLVLIGGFGQAFDLESRREVFRKEFPDTKFETVRDLIINIVLPLTNTSNPMQVQELALDAISLVCQAWPRGYQRNETARVLKDALSGHDAGKQEVVLLGLKNFYMSEAFNAKAMHDAEANGKGPDMKDRLGKSMLLSDNEGAATTISHQFLPSLIQVALDTDDDRALIATEVLTSISNQGLTHPNEVVPTLVALESSSNPQIAKTAFDQHSLVHAKHESLFDREYLSAVETTHAYVFRTSQSHSGVDASGVPRLASFYRVLKTASITTRKRLFAGLCHRSAGEADTSGNTGFARFVTENLGLLEYDKIDEILHVLNGIDKALDTVGNTLLHRMVSELVAQNDAGADRPNPPTHEPSRPIMVDDATLQWLTRSSMVLSMFWETRNYLKRAWALQSLRTGKAKPAARDVNKAPTRAANVTQDELLSQILSITNAMETRDTMITQCHRFIEHMTTDNDAKISSDEDGNEDRLQTPSENGIEETESRPSMPPSSQKSKKKRVSGSVASTPTKVEKKRGRPSMVGRRKSGRAMKEDSDENWD